MKVTHGRISNVYRAINNLSNNPFPIACSMSLYRMKNALREYVDFENDYAVKTAKEVGAEIGDNGRVDFKSAKIRGDFLKKIHELDITEVDVDINPVSISITPELVVSANDIETLEGFVTFTE